MTAIDRFAQFPAVPFGPAKAVFAIAPSDAQDLPYVTAGLYVGGAGDIYLRDLTSGALVTLRNVPAGTILPLRTAHVHATGTSATNLVGLA